LYLFVYGNYQSTIRLNGIGILIFNDKN
jgi:hypothetical protein